MAASNRSNYIAWAILLACIVAVPVGLFSKPKTSETKSGSSKRWAFYNKDHIKVLKLNGAIFDDDSDGPDLFPSVDTPGYVRKQILKAAEDENVKGILLRINSPGGTVGMSQEITDACKKFKAKKKPLVVSMGDVAASGGYYIASAADQIFANPGTNTGSIGVIMHLLNWQETEKKIGLQPLVIKSGQYKDIGSADRPMTPEEKAILQGIIMDSYDQFVSAIAEGRKMDKEKVKTLADGRIYSGRQAKAVNLVDQLGTYEDALAYLQKSLKKSADDKDLPVDDSSSLNFFSSLMSSTSGSSKLGIRSGLFKGILPDYMDSAFNKQPLWIMQ